MRRYARTLILIAILVTVAGLILGIQNIKIFDFERGGDTVLGLSLGLDLQGGSHLVYQAVDTDTREPITPQQDEMAALKRSIEKRVNASGLGEPIIQVLGEDRLLVQLPGVRDLARAKSLIGETAQLVFKHRALGVPRDLDNISGEDIVSVTVGEFPLDGEGPGEAVTEGEQSQAGETAEVSPPQPEAAVEGDQPRGEEGIETTEPQPEAGPEGDQPLAEEGTETTEPEPEAGPEGDQPLAEEGTETTEPEPEAGAEGDQPRAGEEAEAIESQPEAAAEGETEEQPLPPALIVEFTPEGAEKFAEVVDRLRESLQLDENLEPVEDLQLDEIFPNRISISVEGTESRTFQLTFGRQLGLFAEQLGGRPGDLLGPPLIQRIDDSDRFVLSLGGVATDVADARSIFGDEPEVFFNEEIVGKEDEDIGLTGDHLTRAYASQDQQGGFPIVVVEFNQDGSRIFGKLTEQIAGSATDQVAIFLDDEELISPRVVTAITAGTAIIQGRDFTIGRVRDLALLLESGRLPITIDLIQERDVDAILGADSLRKSVIAGVIGLALVLLFMALYYRVPGIIASVALLIYAALVLAIFKILPVTLTLSGVGAVILSIGMAVDANILIFERMKDELRTGRTLMSAINIGFNRAWPAIRDGNVSTLITTGVLFYFSSRLGTTIVQGFAVTLAIGVVVSMFSAITVSRTLLLVISTTALARRLGLFVPTGGAELPQQRQQAAAPVAQRS